MWNAGISVVSLVGRICGSGASSVMIDMVCVSFGCGVSVGEESFKLGVY